MPVRRLLVIGGAGFIGRHLCRAAVDRGYIVASISLNPVGKPVPGVQYLIANLADARSLKSALANRQFEYVVNCGGYIDHRLFRDGGRSLIKSHFDGVQNLIECLDRSSLFRFVQMGSSDEYGNAQAPQREEMREAPISPYSLAKVATTHFLQMLWRTERFPAVTLRLFLTYGPGQSRARFLPQLIHGCLANSRFPVSEGSQLRDFCYIEDVVHGILRSLVVEEACGAVINVASGTPVTIRSIIEQVQVLVGKGEPEFGKIPYRTGENMQLHADVTKAKSILGWEARVALVAGLQETIKYYREKADA